VKGNLMQNILDKVKIEFFKMIDDFGADPYDLRAHIREMEKWARFMLGKYPKANGEIVMLSVFLHDIGHYPIAVNADHAVTGEQRARVLLSQQNYPKDKMEEVLHCVRAHRCSDVIPQTLEAKIIAFIDSASHMTDIVYFKMAKDDKEKNGKFRAYGKIERDFRDLSSFPEIQEEMFEMYDAWKRLIDAYEKLNLI
jgi:HD superfamily phosphodiesterase